MIMRRGGLYPICGAHDDATYDRIGKCTEPRLGRPTTTGELKGVRE